MPHYMLSYAEDRFGSKADFEFDAPTASAALTVAHRQRAGRWADLFEDGRHLCTLERQGVGLGDIWKLAGKASYCPPEASNR